MPRKEQLLPLEEFLTDYPPNLHDTIRWYITEPLPMPDEHAECEWCGATYPRTSGRQRYCTTLCKHRQKHHTDTRRTAA